MRRRNISGIGTPKTRRARQLLLGVAALGLLALLPGCSSVSEDDMTTAAGLVLANQLGEEYGDALDSWRSVSWRGRAELRVDNERMPAWAENLYDECVYWQRPFEETHTTRRQGPDLVTVQTGIGWGWILINRKLEVHVLETGFSWIVLEDDVEVQSDSRIVIDAWDDPAGS